MLCDPPAANEEILPEASQGCYFFNRIGQKQTVGAALVSPDSERTQRAT